MSKDARQFDSIASTLYLILRCNDAQQNVVRLWPTITIDQFKNDIRKCNKNHKSVYFDIAMYDSGLSTVQILQRACHLIVVAHMSTTTYAKWTHTNKRTTHWNRTWVMIMTVRSSGHGAFAKYRSKVHTRERHKVCRAGNNSITLSVSELLCKASHLCEKNQLILC